ncbi:MAG: 16S rRNA (cytosine(1402)-N(4))-methyltransferase RsmH [Acidimicrobiia bacterium]
MAEFAHQPVMLDEIIESFMGLPSGVIVDATLGGGGHAEALLECREDFEVFGIDRDEHARAAAGQRLSRFGSRVRIVSGEFGQLKAVLAQHGVDHQGVKGMLFDLGVSSPQLDRPERGFSYRFDAPLDMRMDMRQSLTADDVVNEYSEADLASVIARYGEEKFAKPIARNIVAARPIVGTKALVDCIYSAVPHGARRRGSHPARRTFQAIRMEVNRELPNLAEGLDDAVHLISPGGRVAVLSYHSLEDRIVKKRFAAAAGTVTPYPVPPIQERSGFRLVTRGAQGPAAAEIERNPRAESAKLRVIERIAE